MINLHDIAREFGLELKGSGFGVDHIATPENQNETSIGWAKHQKALELFSSGAVVCSKSDYDSITPRNSVAYLITDAATPRLMFAKILIAHFSNKIEDDFHNAVEEHRNNKNIIIGENVFIGHNVVIGDGTRVHHNAVIYSNTRIGKNCVINAHASIGTEGLGLEFDHESDLYLKFPQIGGVILEDFVEVGPNSTIRRAALEHTRIGRGTKIGSMCNIGHNCQIGKNCILTCNVITSGSSVIGDHVFMGVSSVVRHRAKVGNNVTLGQGAVVVKDVPDNETWVGNPAKKLK